MKMMEIVIQNILLFYFVITYLGIMLGLLVIENLLLVKKTRQTIAAFFIILTVLTAVACIFMPAAKGSADLDILKMDVKIDAMSIGTQIIVVARKEDSNKKELELLGEFVTNEGEDSEYCNITIKKGEVICLQKPEYAAAIQKTFYEYRVDFEDFQGESMIYQKIIEETKRAGELKKEWTAGSIVKFYFLFLPEFLCALRYAMYVHREKKKKMLKKMKLTDL